MSFGDGRGLKGAMNAHPYIPGDAVLALQVRRMPLERLRMGAAR
jgi:hypothetical protein